MRLRLLPDSPLGWTPYGWLIYLSLFILYALRSRSAAGWVIEGGTLIVFLVLYFRAFWVRGRQLLLFAFGMVALGVLTSPRNPGASAFFIYGASFLGDAARPAVAARWLLLVVAIVGAEALLVPLPPFTWIPAVVFSLIIGGTNIHFAEVRRKDRALLAARGAAEHMAVVAERERIARDLHDLLGHTLSVIVIKSELASKLADRDPARAAAEIRDVEQISRDALQEVRGAIHGYRGESLEQELASGRAALAAAGVVLSSDFGPLPLGPDVERAVALAVREAITNVIRHASAVNCRISAEVTAREVRVTVEDDGVGGNRPEGAGLSGMRVRLAAVGGTMTRDAKQGTRLVLTVPRRREEPAPGTIAS